MHNRSPRAERQALWNPLLHPSHAKVLREVAGREDAWEDAVRRDRERPHRTHHTDDVAAWEARNPDAEEPTDRAAASEAPYRFAGLEAGTRAFRGFRYLAATKKAAAARLLAKNLGELRTWNLRCFGDEGKNDAEPEHAALRKAKFWEGRASGQLKRFPTVMACGSRDITVTSRCHGIEVASIPARCGVVRCCKACAEHRASERRKRLYHARVEVLLDAPRLGLQLPFRAGGRFSEKMLTCTLPHFSIGQVTPDSALAEACEGYGRRTTINARVQALRLAIPKFLSKVRRYLGNELKRCPRAVGANPDDAKLARFYRLFEWTRGHDKNGHPHFHIYVWSPYLPYELLREWWAKCLRKVGAPVGERVTAQGEIVDNVNCDVRELRSFDGHALAELIKKGQRAVQLESLTSGVNRKSHLEQARGATGIEDFVSYADGTIVDSFEELRDAQDERAQVDLYVALEGVRLAQGSRGFLLPKRRSCCPVCEAVEFEDGRSLWNVAFSDPCGARYNPPTGPP